ncbi:hypothetical protein Dimus_009192 [Dionaea muscipula]
MGKSDSTAQRGKIPSFLIVIVSLGIPLPKNPRAENQETDPVSGDGGEEHTTVEGHDGEHDQVGQSHPNDVEQRENEPADAISGVGLHEAATGDPLDEGGEDEDDDEGERVHSAAGARPSVEKDLGVLAPEEGHMLHRHLLHPAAGHRGVGYCRHPSHPMPFLGFLGLCLRLSPL